MMNSEEVAATETELLIEAYRAAANDHGEALEAADSQAANNSADLVATIYRELRRRGNDHQTQLLPLLLDASANVRLWSAAHALEFAAPQGQAVLTELSSREKAIGVSAKATLAEWRAGRLRFP